MTRGVRGLRDPDASQGHHDFQACVAVSRIARKLLLTSGIEQGSRERARVANSMLSPAIREMDGAPSPEGARVLPANPHAALDRALGGEAEWGADGLVGRSRGRTFITSGRGARVLVGQATPVAGARASCPAVTPTNSLRGSVVPCPQHTSSNPNTRSERRDAPRAAVRHHRRAHGRRSGIPACVDVRPGVRRRDHRYGAA
jgi:hypothetical protein